MKKVIVAGDMLREGFKRLEKDFEVVYPPSGRNFTTEELEVLVEDADALLSFFTIKIGENIISKAPKLRIISNFGVGYDNIDIKYASEKGIVVTNTPDPVTIPTAELTIALMLDISRKISFLDRELRANKNYDWNILNNLGVTLHGKTLGIIGMGRIGREVAKRARSFGMRIKYFNRHKLAYSLESGAEYVTKEELISSSDFISVNAPATVETFHILSKIEFDLMKPSAIVVNTSRGNLIDERALISALQNNIIRGAALDVYEKGDGNISEELLMLDNVVCVPHIGTQTIDARVEMADFASQNIILFFNGENPLSKIVCG